VSNSFHGAVLNLFLDNSILTQAGEELFYFSQENSLKNQGLWRFANA
jgi:hypothetical protein